MKTKYLISAAVFVICFVVLAAFILNLDNLLVGDNGYTGPTASESHDKIKTVYIDGEPYLPREEIVNLLVMGLDEAGYADQGGRAQVDFLLLISFNKEDKTYKMYQINRDTMADVDIYNSLGEMIDTKKQQIALSYAYGDKTSINSIQKANNTIKSLSKLLYGVKIHHYVTVTIAGASNFVDEIGGVDVMINQDMTMINPMFVKGEQVSLDGESAIQYLRARKGLDDSTNVARMERHKTFVDAVIQRMSQIDFNAEKLESLYNAVSPYVFTGCQNACFDEIFGYFDSFASAGIEALPGKAVMGEVYIEFYLDEDKMKGLVTNVFLKRAD